MRSEHVVAFALAFVCASCSSGCDGERNRRATARPKISPAPDDAAEIVGPVVAPDDAAAAQLAAAPGFLDAPDATLDALYGALAAAERKEPSARVDLAFFGDSHTAGDSMTSRLRATWQARFGDAGRGVVGAGRPPTRHYYQRDVKYGRSGQWTSAVAGGRDRVHDREPFGIFGLRVSGQTKGAQLWVETCGDCPAGHTASQLEILYYAAPDRGALRVRVDDGAWQDLHTKTAAIEPPHPARKVIAVPDGPHKLLLEHAGGGAVDLFGVVLERAKPGVIVDSLGVVGRRLGSLRSWDWSIIGEQLAARDPRLVVLQYGTNEADDPDLDLEALARYYDETILRIRAAAPTASILVLGPPDVGVREGGKAMCERPRPSRVDAGVQPECEWRTPAILGEIIATEHAAARRNHVAFFDTFAAMGGADQMHVWLLAEPKVAYKDHVHFTDVGYQKWADVLTAAMFGGYERWRAAHGMPTSPPINLPQPEQRPPDEPSPGAPPPPPPAP
jgi:lysophospholipase L1-like esterase